MSAELIAILAVGVTIGGLLFSNNRKLRRDIADLRERMARLEGLFEGFIQRVEARIGCKILNTMTALGMPDSEMIG